MTQFKRFNKQFFLFFKDHPWLILLELILIPSITIIWLFSNHHMYISLNLQVSLADQFVMTGNGLLFYSNLVVIPCFLLSSITYKDLTINYVLRNKNKKSVFLKQSYDALLVTFITSIYQFIVTSIVGFTLSRTLINFNQKQSVFWFINQGKLSSVSFAEVFIFTFIFCFSVSMLFTMFHLVIKWFLHYDIIAFVFIIMIAFCDVYGGLGICRFFGVNYEKWLSYQPLTLLIPILGALICFLIGLSFSERKELLHAK